jgi:hypothetical protein
MSAWTNGISQAQRLRREVLSKRLVEEEHTVDVSGWVRKELEAASPDLLRAMVKDFAEGILVTASGTATGSRFVSSQSSPMESPLERLSGTHLLYLLAEGRLRVRKSQESSASATASSTVNAWPCSHASVQVASSSCARMVVSVSSFIFATHESTPPPVSS